MDFLAPTSLAEALAAKAEQPDAVPVAGGYAVTDPASNRILLTAAPGGSDSP